MELTWWWLGVLLLVAAALVAGLALRRARGAGEGTVLLAAHTSRLTQLPAYRAALAALRRHLLVLAVLLGLAIIPAAFAASRPATGQLVEPEKRNRDIVLCLDVSGSMRATNQAIMLSFADLVAGFRGERIGLVLFDSLAVTAFPLTDDYDLVKDQLESYAAGFDYGSTGPDPRAGTWSPGNQASSLVPDGLASCAAAFDRPDQERPRAIVLGTDNLVHGQGVYTLEEAVQEASDADIRVYGLDPVGSGVAHDELVTATEDTGGKTYALTDTGAVSGLAQEIERLEAQRLEDTTPQYLRTDRPRWPVLLLALALLGYLPLAWRWRR